jgi:hypothetical protein
MNCFLLRASMIWAIVFSFGCNGSRSEPSKRPSSVPESAVWAGGADGGIYVLCTVDETLNVNRCTIWDDYTGRSRSGSFRLAGENRAAMQSELVYRGAMMMSNYQGTITLKGGKRLEAIDDHH